MHRMSNTYTTGTGQKLLNVHDEDLDCRAFGCVIHNPTDPNQHWPTHWDALSMRLWRKAPDGTLHHDRDVLDFERRRAEKRTRLYR